jgi:hypothetical protein
MAGGVDDVHCSHVLIQEVTADGNGIAATAVVLLDGDSRGEPGPCRAQAAPGGGGRSRGLRARNYPSGGSFLPLSSMDPIQLDF